MRRRTRASATGRALYNEIWTTVGAAYFDPGRLTAAAWPSWQHRFDDSIDGIESALTCADEMLASLNDTYTERVIVRPVASAAATTNAAPADDNLLNANVFVALRDDNIAYLRIGTFDSPTLKEELDAAIRKIANCDGLVLDLRNNGGGRIDQALEFLNYCLKEGLLTTLELRHADGITTRKYYLNANQFFSVETAPDGSSTTEMFDRRPPLLAGKPIVILINARTASASELSLVALVQNGENGKVAIVGSGTTPGKGIGQAPYFFLDGTVEIRVTRTRWLCPGGEWLGDCGQTERNGVEPWVMVEGDHGPEGFKAAYKELLKLLEAKAA